MPNFQYQALNNQGQEVRGALEAENLFDLSVKLKKQEIYLVKVIEKNAISASNKISLIDIVSSTRQLATLLEAGLSLDSALYFLEEQFKGRALAQIFAQIYQSIKGGESFSQSLSKHPKQFNNLYVSMVYAGEKAGNLDQVLSRLADLLENQMKLRGRIEVILAYPVLMLCIGTGVLFFLLSFVVPMIAEMFVQLGRQLPLPTLILITISSFFKKFWWLLLLIAAIFIFSARFYIRKPKGRLFFDQLKLRAPMVSELFLKASVTNLSRTLCSLLAGGVEIITALEIVKDTSSNQVISKAVESVKESVSKGARLSSALERHKVFPPLFIRMVSAGEKSGQLPQMLLKSSEIYENELTVSVNKLVALLEPALILAVGLIVGFIVLAILLPIMSMSQLVR